MSAAEIRACPNCGASVGADARFCANCGTPVATPAAEERKLATIVFADVSGSTDLGEQLDPERLRAVLTEYFAAMAQVIRQWGGTVEKYIGDAILAVFGVPAAREDDAVRALHAAQEMLDQIAKLNRGFEERHGVRLAVRIGVNSGEVLVPSGAVAGGQFLVSGDPVNVASRLQAAAEPGSILVGERTWTAARDQFSFDDAIAMPIKGKREPVVARRLGPPRAIEETVERVRFQVPMIGRDRELQTLLGVLDESVETQMPRLVVVSGPAGIGKSRMLREFIAAATERHAAIRVLRGRCLAAGHGVTFWALGEILRSWAGISLDEPADTAVEKLRSVADETLATLRLGARELDETIAALATSASLPISPDPLDELAPDEVADAMARAWPRLLTAAASQAPLAIVIEDLHWADERMVAMIELLAARSRGPVVVVATARPEFLESHPSFASGQDLTVTPLRPLTDSQSERLIAELLGESARLQQLLSDVRQKADGNPLFLEEILQRLIEERAIVREDGRWEATERAQGVQLPDTIHALLAARIDALPAEEKALLQQAAVVGRIFWPGSLRVTGDAGPSAELLRSLERRGLIAARPVSSIDGEVEYIFRHVLIRDVAYASVPKARRALAHADTGEWIEELAADRVDEFGELVAYHYTAAVSGEDADLAWADAPDERERLRQRAFTVLISAGAAARRRFAVEKAIALHEQARELARNDGERSQVYEALGDDHEALFHMDEAVENYLAAVDAQRSATNDAPALARLASKLARTAQRWGAFRSPPPVERVRSLIDEALEREIGEAARAELLLSRAALARRAAARGRSTLPTGDRSWLTESIASAETGLALAKRLDDPALMHQAYESLDMLYWMAGKYEQYRAMEEEDAKLIDRLTSERDKVETLVGLASIRAEAGRYREGLEVAERALSMAADLSAHERMHASYHVMWTAGAVGEWDRVLEILPWHSEAAAAEPDVSCPNVRGGPALGATVLVHRGQISRALELAPVDEDAVSRESFGDRAVIARYAALVGRQDVAAAIVDSPDINDESALATNGMEDLLEALALLERYDQIDQLLPRAREMSAALEVLTPLADRLEAEIVRRRGDIPAARRLLEHAVAGFDRLSLLFDAARAREALAAIAGPESERLLREALESYERLGARPFAERVRTSLDGGTRVAAQLA